MTTAANEEPCHNLRASEEYWRVLLDNVPTPVQGYGPDGVVFFWNRASERVYGFSAKEAIGRNLGALIVPPALLGFFRQALELGGALTKSGPFLPPGEVELRRKNGSPVSVYSTHTAVCAPGEPPRLFCLDVDLTELKRTEDDLRAANNELRQFNEAMVGRELRMIELKRENDALRAHLGLPAKYDAVGPEAAADAPLPEL